MRTKQLLCSHGELEAACAICFVSDLKTQLRECEKQLDKAEKVIRFIAINNNLDMPEQIAIEKYFKEKDK